MMIALHTVKAAFLCEEWKPKNQIITLQDFTCILNSLTFFMEKQSINGCSVDSVYFKGIFDREK